MLAYNNIMDIIISRPNGGISVLVWKSPSDYAYISAYFCRVYLFVLMIIFVAGMLVELFSKKLILTIYVVKKPDINLRTMGILS